MVSELPAGWTSFTLSELGGLSGGKTPSKANQSFWASRDVPWVSPKDMKNFHITDSEDRISEAALRSASMVLYPASSILMVTRSGILQHTFPVAMAKVDVTVNQDIKVAKPSDNIDPDFLLYALRALGQTVLQTCSKAGTTVQSIDTENLEALRIPLPPLAEQKRIAQKLDALLAQVDTLKARIDAIPTLLKHFRKSILSNAVSGRMTGTPVAMSAKGSQFLSPLVFFASEQGDKPQHWRWVKLVDAAVLESGHTPRKSFAAYWEGGDVPWISLQDIRAADGTVITETKMMPTALGIQNSSARLLPEGTVCFSRDISVGFVTVMGRSMATTQHFANWICSDLLLSKYLMYAFMAGRDHLLKSGQGSTVKTIYMPALKELRLVLPPVSEQREMVRRVEHLFALADQLETKVIAAQKRIDTLTQSLLAKAFRGELVPQDPNDEPASVLLERIRGQCAAAPKPRRGRKAVAR